MNDIKDSVYMIVNFIIDEESNDKIGTLTQCKTDSECSPDLCDKNRNKCFKYIKYDENKSYPIDIFIRKMFESNIDEVKPFEYMFNILKMTDCISRIHISSEKDDSTACIHLYNELESDFYYKYSGDSCKGFSIIFIYNNHANIILVENVKDFLIWNFYDPHIYEDHKGMKKIEHMGELCAKIANKKFVFNYRKGSQCPIMIQKLLEDYEPGYCVIFSYFWIWCVLNVIKQMTSYIPSNKWISYVEKCVSEQIQKNPIKVYKKVGEFAYTLYSLNSGKISNEKLNASDYMKKHEISINDYNVRMGEFDIKQDNALINAIEQGYFPVVKYLTENGADIHANREEALIKASTKGYISIVRYLIEKGADIHAGDDRAIVMAIDGKHLDIVKYLLENGANIHGHQNYVIRSALIQLNDLSFIKYLMEKGARLIPREISLEDVKNQEILKYLRTKGIK